MSRAPRVWVFVSLALALACSRPAAEDRIDGAAGTGGAGDGGPETAPPDAADPSAPLFDPNHIVEVRIDMTPADWDALRLQTRDLWDILGGDCVAAPFASPFTYFTGTVTVDGQRLDNVGIKKKGFLGSLSTSKPGLKLKICLLYTSDAADE